MKIARRLEIAHWAAEISLATLFGHERESLKLLLGQSLKPAALNGTVRLGYDTWMAINPEDTILRDDLVLSSAQYNDLKQDLNYG